jgi:hypothetical protein
MAITLGLPINGGLSHQPAALRLDFRCVNLLDVRPLKPNWPLLCAWLDEVLKSFSESILLTAKLLDVLHWRLDAFNYKIELPHDQCILHQARSSVGAVRNRPP